jgi:hypothetical protein
MESSQLADGPELSTDQRQLIERVASLAERLRDARTVFEIGSIIVEMQTQLAALAATIPAPIGNRHRGYHRNRAFGSHSRGAQCAA